MRILIIQENGHHEANRNFRECFCLKRGFEHCGAEADVWGKLHDNYNKHPDWKSYDLIISIENWDWMPDLSKVQTPKFMWAIDAHCKGPYIYNLIAHNNNFNKVFHATPEFAQDGCWLPNCYDDTIIKPIDCEKTVDVGFCGNTVNRGGFIDLLKTKYGSNFKHDEMVLGNNMVKAINSYKVHWNKNMSVDINYRNFETMGCKTCLCTSSNDHYNKLGFISGENCLTWESPSEMFSKIDTAVNNKELCDSIAEKGYNLVVNNHTYKHRANQILGVLNG